MKRLLGLTSAPIGSVVKFWYRGGGTPNGGWREVRVDKVERGFLKGFDLEKEDDDNYRQYDTRKATDVMMIEPPKSIEQVYFTEARDRLHNFIDNLNGEDLAELYRQLKEPEADKVEYNMTGYVEVTKPAPRIVGEMNALVVNEAGQRVELNATVDENGDVHTFIDGKAQQLTAEEWQETILRHLTG